MFTGVVRTPLSPVVRSFWRCVALFLLFVQLAAAAAPCREYTPCGGSSPQAIGTMVDRHHAVGSEFCANEYVPANQLPASDAAIPVPALGPAIEVAALWPPAPSVQVPPAPEDAEPFAAAPRFLTFRRLLR